MPAVLITSEQLKNRVGKYAYLRVFDDENSGDINEAAELQLRKDATGSFLGRVGAVYNVNDLREMDADDLPEEVVRITLDIAQAMMAIRAPNILECDGHRMMRRVDEETKALRMNINTMGVTTPPEPAANSGGEVFSLNEDTNYEPEAHTFLNGFGDF